MPEKRDLRIIISYGMSGYENMAIDEAVLTLHNEFGMDTLRLYTWEPSAVSIGYFQSLEREVDMGACRARGIDVVRRVTGGGAVYHDRMGEVTYSIVVGAKDPRIPHNIVDSYRYLSHGIITALNEFGLKAEFAPVNDIVLNGKKISGNAQTRRKGRILQHGTVLYDLDATTMFSVLKVGDEKIRDKMIASVYDRVTSIRHEGMDIERGMLIDALKVGFLRALDATEVKEGLTSEEKALAEKLVREKYSTDEWNRKR